VYANRSADVLRRQLQHANNANMTSTIPSPSLIALSPMPVQQNGISSEFEFMLEGKGYEIEHFLEDANVSEGEVNNFGHEQYFGEKQLAFKY